MIQFEYNKFQFAVNTLLELNKQNREICEQLYMDPISYAREFGTVHVNCGRRAGKTQYIVDHATDKDLILVSNVSHKKLFKEAFTQALTVHDLNHACGFPDPVNIYVEDPSYIFKGALQGNLRISNMTDLYKKLAKNYNQTFILLGE